MSHRSFFTKCAVVGIGLYAVALVCLMIWAGQVSAQETYSVPGSATNVNTLTRIVTGWNGDTCQRFNIARPPNAACTQAAVCTAANAPGGASCTAAQARGANVRIFPLTQAGREEFLQFMIVLPDFTTLAATNEKAENKRAFCVGWTAATNANKDSTCTALGLPTGWVAGNGAGCDPGC